MGNSLSYSGADIPDAAELTKPCRYVSANEFRVLVIDASDAALAPAHAVVINGFDSARQDSFSRQHILDVATAVLPTVALLPVVLKANLEAVKTALTETTESVSPELLKTYAATVFRVKSVALAVTSAQSKLRVITTQTQLESTLTFQLLQNVMPSATTGVVSPPDPTVLPPAPVVQLLQ